MECGSNSRDEKSDSLLLDERKDRTARKGFLVLGWISFVLRQIESMSRKIKFSVFRGRFI